MGLKDLDIVYTLKDRAYNEELKYSLRSLKNIPHKDVYIFGGCPVWINHDTVKHIHTIQDKQNKWLNTSHNLEEIVNNENVSEDFIWFNDDFFVLKQIDELPYYHDRTLSSRIMDFAKISYMAMNNAYCSRLKKASRELKMRGETALNYELHLPMIFNKAKLKKVIEEYPGFGAKRSLYGNTYVKDSIQRSDVKIYDNETIPDEDWDFVSTSDKSFIDGKVGKYIKNKFRRKGEYEQ